MGMTTARAAVPLMTPRIALAAALAATAALLPPPAAWAQVDCPSERIVSPDGVPGGSFGSGVRLHNGQLFVKDAQARTRCPGSPLSCSTGAVHVFERREGAWEPVQTIVPPDAGVGDSFGISMDFSGDRLIVGASEADIAEPDAGGAYIYEFDGERWVEAARIDPPDPGFMRGFGLGVMIDGEVAIVRQGRLLYVFQLSNGAWQLSETLTVPDADRSFGAGRALGERWLLVGAPLEDTIETNGGAVYAFRRSGPATFDFAHKLTAPAGLHGRIGQPIAIDGDTAYTGAIIADGAQGLVFELKLSGGLWRITGQIEPTPAVEDARFGGSMTIAGNRLLVGASNERTSTGGGAAYVFGRDHAGRWRQLTRILAPCRTAGFGASVSMNSQWAVLGARDELVGGESAGAAHVFDLSCVLCLPDLNADGELTIFDFLTFQNLFDAGDLTADFDGDGELTIFDFLAFQTAFDAGCE